MADTFSASYAVTWKAQTQSNDDDRLNKVLDAVEAGASKMAEIQAELADGTGASSAQKHWSKKLTVASAATTTLTLTDGSLLNGRAQAVAFTNVRRVLIHIRDPLATKTLVVGGTFLMGRSTGTETVTDLLLKVWDLAGIAITAGWTVTLNNTGSVSLDVDVSIIGH